MNFSVERFSVQLEVKFSSKILSLFLNIAAKNGGIMSVAAKALCIIACHGGPADHFATFVERLTEQGCPVQVCASGPALKKFEERNITVDLAFDAEVSKENFQALAQEISKACSARVVLTDVGHAFDEELQRAFAEQAPQVLRLAYYDNPEPFVPGGYSDVAARVMSSAHRVLCANSLLVQDGTFPAPREKRVAIGYYPVTQAEQMVEKRRSASFWRNILFSNLQIPDEGQKILVYFGGNNTNYFNKAFPAFLQFLSQAIDIGHDLSNFIVVLQQHPGAKAKNEDWNACEVWIRKYGLSPKAPRRICFSNKTSQEIMVVADAALYFQTSMGPLFALSGIPTIQVAHETYPDVLVRGGLCPSVTNAEALVKALSGIQPITVSEQQKATIYKSLGIQEKWLDNLKKALCSPPIKKPSVARLFLPFMALAVIVGLRILRK